MTPATCASACKSPGTEGLQNQESASSLEVAIWQARSRGQGIWGHPAQPTWFELPYLTVTRFDSRQHRSVLEFSDMPVMNMGSHS
jgi:hypothetical protein